MPRPESSPAHGWGARIAEAVLHFSAAQRRRIALEEFGDLVAQEEGRGEPYRKATVSGWTKEMYEPGIATFEAIARLVGCDPWWLVWGVGRPPTNVALQHFRPFPRGSGGQEKAEGE